MLTQYLCTIYIGTEAITAEFWAKGIHQAKSIAEEHKRLQQARHDTFASIVLVRKLDKKTVWM
jgi:hypothetical protein